LGNDASSPSSDRRRRRIVLDFDVPEEASLP
jgi:hypothetical protein